MNLHDVFAAQFSGAPTWSVRSPGRVNLIGEHVDYNDGFVLPMAVSLQTEFLIRERADSTVVLHSPIFNETRTFDLNLPAKTDSWIDYAQGVAVQLAAAGVPLTGFDGVVTSNIPLASGLSSSASFEVGIANALLSLAGVSWPAPEVALLCQRAENQFVGVNCGIMDQMAVAACTAAHALLLDCRTIALRQVPFQLADHVVIVTDSAAPRELASSAYNERRAQCEEGLALLQGFFPKAKALRDITPEQLESHADALSPIVLARVRHIVGEIARTLAAVDQLEAGDLVGFGQRMNESHYSLRDLYAVSSAELDWLTDWARNRPGVLGSRMTGAGFGGCTVSLVEKGAAEAFVAELPPAYRAAMGREARSWICDAEPGASATKL